MSQREKEIDRIENVPTWGRTKGDIQTSSDAPHLMVAPIRRKCSYHPSAPGYKTSVTASHLTSSITTNESTVGVLALCNVRLPLAEIPVVGARETPAVSRRLPCCLGSYSSFWGSGKADGAISTDRADGDSEERSGVDVPGGEPRRDYRKTAKKRAQGAPDCIQAGGLGKKGQRAAYPGGIIKMLCIVSGWV